MKRKASYTIIGAIAFLAGMGISIGQTTPNLNYYWDEPTTGSPVVEWMIMIEFEGQDVVAVTVPNVINEHGGRFLLPYPYGETVRIRVLGVDAQGRYNADNWSPWSDWWNDDGAPGDVQEISATLVLI